tara:strand:- start:842 stop:1336 length:495 start_codon:yes stop_codon:yes gene_type:complete
LDPSGNRVFDYTEALGNFVKEMQPASVVEIGVGTGNSLLAMYSVHPHASYLGVDLFRREGPVDQLQEFHSNVREAAANVHVIQAPGDFPARSYFTNQIDLVHLDILDPHQANRMHTIRLLFTSWATKTKKLIVPRETCYEDALGDMPVESSNEFFTVLGTQCLK